MDGNGGCCIGNYATGAHDMSKVDKIMLRFRPIAPKPAAGGSSPKSGDAFSRYSGGKRKSVRVQNSSFNNINSNERCNRRRKYSPKQNHPVVTLPLLPETPDPKDFPAIDLTASPAKEALRTKAAMPVLLSFENCSAVRAGSPATYWCRGTCADQAPDSAGSCVTVECVTDTWVEGEGLGSSDEEMRANLRKDTCPGFISDGLGRVTWTNGSYGKMVGQEGKEVEAVRVWLVMKEDQKEVVTVSYRSFTCRVKVQYTRGKAKGSLTVPCDVWKMDSGGFAWRLDVKAALSLSLSR